MKIVILHENEGYVEVVPVEEPSDQFIANGHINASDYLRETGRDPDENPYVVFGNEVPVFWDKEVVPFVTL